MASARARVANTAYRYTLRPVLRREQDVERLRRHLDRFAPLAGRPPSGTRIERLDCGSFTAERISVRDADPPRCILYFPGGGFVARSPPIHRSLLARACHEAHADGMLVFYRLAPEHPFPAAVEDCIESYHRLLADGVPASAIVFGGDSAGGCLVLSVLMALRDEGAPLPAAGFLLSPVTDLRDHRQGSRSANQHADVLLTMDRTLDLHGLYVGGDEQLLTSPKVSPVFGDFTGLPPLLFHVSAAEILLDDSLRAAERARAAGVACEVEVFEEMPHVWHLIRFLPEADRALRRIGAFARRHTRTARLPRTLTTST